MSRRQPRQPDPAVEQERQQINQEHATANSTATQEAARAAPDWSELQSKEFIDSAFTPEINRPSGPNFDNNRIEEKLAAEFGRHAGLSNIRREDWEEQKLMNRAKAILLKQEYARPNGLGSRCNEKLREKMTGQGQLPTMDDDLGREIDAAFEERTMLQALSIDARGFRGLTEVTAVSKSEGFDGPETDNGGLLATVTGGLFGGG